MPRDTLVSQIQRPELTKPGRDSVVKFKEEFDEYTRLIDTFNTDRTPATRLRKATIRECIKVDLLENLIMTNLIPEVENIQELSNEQVMDWFNGVLSKEPRNLGDKVTEIVRKHTHRPNSGDPEAGVQEYVFEVMTDLRALGGAQLMKDKSQAKNVINRLGSGLKPKEVRELLFRDKTMWKEGEHTSISHFIARAGEIATQVQRMEEIRPTRDNTGGSGSGEPTPRRRRGSETRRGGTPRTDEDRRRTPAHDDEKRRKTGGPRKDIQWTRPCINPDCSGKHRIEDCPNTPESEKKPMLEAYIHKMKEKRRERYSGKSISTVHSRYNIEVDIGGVSTRARDDTGADVTIIPSTLLRRIIEKSPKVEVRELEKPVDVELAVQDKSIPSIQVKREVTTAMTIYVPGSRLPVKVRNARILVAEMGMSTVLLGRDLLDHLGFSFTKYLAENYDVLKDTDVKSGRAKCAYAGVKYNDVDDDPITPQVDLSEQFGDDTPEAITKALNERVQEARNNGLSEQGTERLRAILRKHINCFGIKLGTHPPARIEPFDVKLKPDAKPYRASQRRYGPIQQRFIEETIRNLEKIGAVYRNPTAKWASPALAVPKPGSKQLRFTVDLRGVNGMTMVIQSGMPHLEAHLQQCEGSQCYANLDFCHGFWQIPLAKASQEIMSIMTHVGIFSPTRTLQGGSDSGCYFHDVTRDKFAGRVHKLVQWIDDYLLHEEDEGKLLDALDEFLTICEEWGFRVHALKSHFFLTRAKFCGRILSDGKVTYDPRNLDALLKMRQPKRADELQQLLCAANWMRNAIPSFAELIAPLHTALDKVCEGMEKRTKRALAKLDISTNWGHEQDCAFDKLKTSLANSTSLSFPKDTHTICLFTDASECHWSAILCQCPSDQMDNPVTERAYEPLGFASGSFKNSAANWSMPEKEGFAIVEAMTRFDYITLGRQVHIFTDHANLIIMYDPTGVSNSLPRYAVNKLMRWAIKLSAFNYMIEHIPGESNDWADMLSRWANHERTEIQASRVRLQSLMLAPISPSLSESYEWPRPKDIIKCQPRNRPGKGWELRNSVWVNEKGEIFIPREAKQLRLRILVAAHAGLAGHRGRDPTIANLEGRFWWQEMRKDAEDFVKSCLHCLTSDSGNTVPRPLGHALHASEPNEVIHFDYCYLGKSTGSEEYVLIIKDDLTAFTWLKPVATIDSVSTADCLLEWFSNFGTAKNWISDQGTHFLNETMEEIRDRTKSKHHFTLPYTPWSNGTVEVVCRELKRMTKALLNEFQLPAKSWKSTLSVVQSALNNTKLKRLNNECPMTLFTGRPQDTPVGAIVTKHGQATRVHNIEHTRLEAIMNTKATHAALENMHRQCAALSDLRRRQSVNSHNLKTNVRPVNFTTGDFVLRGDPKRGKKLQLTWRGPFKVTECRSEFLFEIEDLLTKQRSVAHGRRLKHFRNSEFEITEDVTHHLEYQQGELLVIDNFDDIREKDGQVECLVRWKGFSDEERDWVAYETLKEDVPDLIREFLDDTIKSGTKRQRQLATRLK